MSAVMRSRVGQLPVEITRPESPKFHHPLLLLHGRWSGAWVWERFMPFLAHRGWESWAPSLLESDAQRSLPELAAAVQQVARAMPGAPILMTHDAGIVLAADLVPRVGVPAVAALAPVLVATPGSPLGRARGWLSWLRPAPVAAEAAALARSADAFVGGVAGARERLVPDATLTTAVGGAGATVDFAAGLPGMIVVGATDAIAAGDAAGLARRAGWEMRAYRDRGHLLQLETGWEEIGGDLHRWIVRTLGAPLLAMLDDEES